jgi:hypothetical protein
VALNPPPIGVKVPRDNARAVETLLQLSRAAREDLSDNMETVLAIPTSAFVSLLVLVSLFSL